MAELTTILGGNKYDEFKHDANEVLHFKLVRSESDVLDDSIEFQPDMCHQIFGDSESIFGYKDLKVNIFCSAAKMTTYIGIDYTDKVSQATDGIFADDIMKVLADMFQPGYMTNKDDFTTLLGKEAAFRPYGTLVNSYTVNKDGKGRHFEVYKTKIDAPGFRDYHERLQPFLLFYVDAASYIDSDDDRWDYYLLFEKYQCDGCPMYAFAGYMTAYNYYAYPEKIRPRLSQVLVLPPFQRQGHGGRLLQTFYNDCYARSEVLDITVEDPSENFQRLRDFIDTRNCMKLPCFEPDYLYRGFSEEMAKMAKEKLKINKKQARRIYEILRLNATNFAIHHQGTCFRLDIKRRLNLPFQKNGRDFEKLQRVLQPNELAATMNSYTLEQRVEYLEKAYTECVEEYKHILERVAAASWD